jgi:hypothetical protein
MPFSFLIVQERRDLVSEAGLSTPQRLVTAYRVKKEERRSMTVLSFASPKFHLHRDTRGNEILVSKTAF